MKWRLVFMFAILVPALNLSIAEECVPIETESEMWNIRFSEPGEAVEFFFGNVNRRDFERAFFVLDNSVQNLLRALTATMDSSPFAKEGKYILGHEEISNLVGNDQVQWQSLVFLFDQLMAVGIERDLLPFSLQIDYSLSDVCFFGEDSYALATMIGAEQEIQVLLRRDSLKNWRLLGVSDVERTFFWPSPVEKLWHEAMPSD